MRCRDSQQSGYIKAYLKNQIEFVGRYGSIGSSDVAVEVVLKILIKLFELGDHFEIADINSIILNGCNASFLESALDTEKFEFIEIDAEKI